MELSSGALVYTATTKKRKTELSKLMSANHNMIFILRFFFSTHEE
jgi:hypothetical protein